MINIYIFSIVINKFCYKKKSYPVILFKVYKNLKISFYYAILFFCLIIYLKIKSN